jgi:archaellum component FlaC
MFDEREIYENIKPEERRDLNLLKSKSPSKYNIVMTKLQKRLEEKFKYKKELKQYRKDIISKMNNVSQKFKDFDTKKVHIDASFELQKDINEVKIKNRKVAIDKAHIATKLYEIGIDKARVIVDTYPSAIIKFNELNRKSFNEFIADELENDATEIEKEIKEMKKTLANAVRTVRRHESYLLKIGKVTKAVTIGLITFGKIKPTKEQLLIASLERNLS